MKGKTMAEETTTEVPEEAGAEALPVDSGQTEAAQTTEATEEPTQESEEKGGETPVPEAEDDKLKKFAESHGIELDSDNAKKAAKMAMDNQAEFQRNRQKATELEKSMVEQSDTFSEAAAEQTGQDPEVLKRINRMEVKQSIRDFWDDHPEARKHEQAIKAKIQESGVSGTAEAVLRAGWAMVVADNPDILKSQGKKEALQSLAHKQQAAVPNGKATNPAASPKSKDFNDLSISEMEAQLGFAKV